MDDLKQSQKRESASVGRRQAIRLLVLGAIYRAVKGHLDQASAAHKRLETFADASEVDAAVQVLVAAGLLELSTPATGECRLTLKGLEFVEALIWDPNLNAGCMSMAGARSLEERNQLRDIE